MKLLIAPVILALSFVASAQTPSAIESELLGYLDAISKAGSYNGDFDEEKNAKANDALRHTIVRNGKRLDILRFAFPKLQKRMYVVTSRDGSLRIYSWDLETGGTMHDFDCVFQYRDGRGAVHTWTGAADDEIAGGFYTQIFQVDTNAGPIYLANSNYIAQGNIHGQSIEAMRITGEKLYPRSKVIHTASGLTSSIDFVYDPSSLGERSERLISFDSAKREFMFPVVLEDGIFENGKVTDRHITYRFDGRYFVKVG